MSEPGQIDEGGFDNFEVDNQGTDAGAQVEQAVEDQPKPLPNDKSPKSVTKAPFDFKQHKTKVIAGVTVVAVLAIGGLASSGVFTSNNSLNGFDLGSASAGASPFDTPVVPEPQAQEPDLTQTIEPSLQPGSGGAAGGIGGGGTVVDYNFEPEAGATQLPIQLPSPDALATMLANYPTLQELETRLSEIKGADVSAAEMDVFLLAVKRNSEDIRALLNGNDYNELRSQLKNLQAQLGLERERNKQLEALVGQYEKNIADLKKNQGWFINRLDKLEGKGAAASSGSTGTKSSARRLSVETVNNHEIRGIADHVVFIQINGHGKPVRATRGYNVPGCGTITSINPLERKVITTNCTIK